jgi:hypothetical protein
VARNIKEEYYLNDKIKRIINSEAYKNIASDIDKRNMHYNTSKHIGGKLYDPNSPEDLFNFDVPQHIKDLVNDAVFNYLDKRGVEYVKAECSLFTIDGRSYPATIQSFDLPRTVRFKIPFGSEMYTKGITVSEVWTKIAHYLPNAIVSSVDQQIDEHLEYMDMDENFSEYTILFTDFAKTIMQVPEGPSGMIPIMPMNSDIMFAASTHFHVAHKTQFGITPDFTLIEINDKLNEDNKY